MKKLKLIRKLFPRVTKCSNGDNVIFMVDSRSRRYGTNTQYKRTSEVDAIKLSDELRIKLNTTGSSGLRVKSDAENIRLKNLEDGLPPGITIESVLNRFKEEQAKLALFSYPEIEPLVNEWFVYKAENKLNPITAGALRDCKSYCGWIARHWGKLKCNEVTQAMVETAISGKDGTSGSTKRKYKLFVSMFFKWLIEKKKIEIPNPAKGIEIAVKETDIQIYSIMDIQRMLEYTEQHMRHMSCFYVLATWIGARPSEVYRMTWADVNFSTSEIAVDARGKTGARYIHAEDSIMEYLRKQRDASPYQPLVPKFVKNQATMFRSEIKSKLQIDWIPDGLRHTSVSMFYARVKDWEKVEFRFGHDKETSKKYYMRPTSKEHLELFWNMLGK